MPIQQLHKDKFKTNMAILIALMAFIALLFGITVVKISGQKSEPIPANLILSEDAATGQSTDGTGL